MKYNNNCSCGKPAGLPYPGRDNNKLVLCDMCYELTHATLDMMGFLDTIDKPINPPPRAAKRCAPHR